MPSVSIPGVGQFGLGWKPGFYNPHELAVTFDAATVAALPASNHRFAQFLPPIWDQGQLGACTAHGILRCVLFAMAKANQPVEMLSRLMLYYNERATEGTTDSDAGAIIADGIDSLVKQGACLESLWPYDISKFADAPPQQCYADAIKHQVIKKAAVPADIGQIKATLAAGYPVTFGMTCFSSLQSAQTAQTGIVPIPGPRERVIGGHCCAFNGFWDDARQLLGFDNSWSEAWGQSGAGALPYWFIANGAVSDCQVVYAVEGDLPTPTPVPPTPTPQPGALPTITVTGQTKMGPEELFTGTTNDGRTAIGFYKA